MSYLEPEVDQRLYSIEDRLPTTITTGPSGNYVEDEEMIKLVVQEELSKKTEIDKDLETRKHNIIHSVQDPGEETRKRNREENK